MKYYSIKGKDQGWGLVNLSRITLVDFDEAAGEIVFDNLIRIKVDERDYKALRKDILQTMFKSL